MSRSVSDSDLIALADKLAWWMPSWPGEERMRTLREAITEGMARPASERLMLFRAGGFGEPAIWLERDDLTRLSQLLNLASVAA